MKVKDYEKAFFENRDKNANEGPARLNDIVMRKYIDAMKVNCINLETKTLINQIIKNGLIFNAVYDMRMMKNYKGQTGEIFRLYNEFIANLNKLPTIEKVYVVIYLKKVAKQLKKNYIIDFALGNLKKANDHKAKVEAIDTALLALNKINQKETKVEEILEKQ